MPCQVFYDTYNDYLETAFAIVSLRQSFIEEARRHLNKDLNYKKMTTIQTYAIMFLVELSCGNALQATSHSRLAAENLLTKQPSVQASESAEIATRGIERLHV